jgi:hypothetical protein
VFEYRANLRRSSPSASRAGPPRFSPSPSRGGPGWGWCCLTALLLTLTLSLPTPAAHAQSPNRAQSLSDPTAPVTRGGPAGQRAQRHWQLQSTLVGAERRVAVINGAVVTEGDTVDGAFVHTIDYTTVLLEANGRPLRLRLFGAEPASDDSRGNP